MRCSHFKILCNTYHLSIMGRAGKLEGLRNFVHMWEYIFTVYVCLGLYSSTVFLATRRNLQHRKYHQCPINHPRINCNHSHTIGNINWFPWRETCRLVKSFTHARLCSEAGVWFSAAQGKAPIITQTDLCFYWESWYFCSWWTHTSETDLPPENYVRNELKRKRKNVKRM